MRLVLAAALLAAAPSLAQQAEPAQPSADDDPTVIEGVGASEGAGGSDDCTFLTRAFAGLYEGLRAEAGGDLEAADPVRVTMYTAIQGNTILLAQAAGCDVAPMVEIAREQLGQYHEGALPPAE